MRLRHLFTAVTMALLGVWLTPALAEDKVLGDVVFVRKTKGDEDFPPATFSHWKHRAKFKCFVCHNKEMGFEMKAGIAQITMDGINDGKHCGACHKGQPAFGVDFTTCARCHRP